MIRLDRSSESMDPGAGSSNGTTVTAMPPAWHAWFSPFRFLIFLVLCLGAAFPDVWTGTHSFYHRDFGLFGYPLAQYHRDAVWAGEWPWWNPMSNCGIPFMAQWNTLVFYPFSAVYLLLPMPWSLNLFCLGHLVLAGMGMYQLAWNWTHHRFAACVAGAAFCFSGLSLNCLMWPNNVAALGWMPWVILLVERGWTLGGRSLLAGILVATLQMLSGAPEIILFTWFILGLLRLSQWGQGEGGSATRIWWMASLRMAGMGLFVAGLCAVQLIPFLDLLGHSHRGESYGDSIWAMPWWGWANLLVPLYGATPSLTGLFTQNDQQWTSSYYMGVGVLALALMALMRNAERNRRIWWVGGIALFGLVMALGDHGHLFRWIKTAFPPFGFARFPVKFVLLAVWAVPLLAAFAVAHLDRRGFFRNRCDLVTGVGVTSAFLVLIAFLLWRAGVAPEPGQDLSRIWQSGGSRAGILVGLIVLLAMLPGLKTRGLPIIVRWTAIGVIALDGLTHLPLQNPILHAHALEPGVHRNIAMPETTEGRALISPRTHVFMDNAGHPNPMEKLLGHRRSLYPNWNLVDGVAMINGFFSLYLQNQRDIWIAFYEDQKTYPQPLADFVGATHVTSDETLFAWETRPSAQPIVTAGQQPSFHGTDDILDQVRSPEFDPSRVVVLPQALRDEVTVTEPSHPEITVLDQAAGIWRIEVEAPEPCLVVIAQTDAPGWTATVDGETRPIWRANHAFQAVEVPQGQHEVVLTYQDRGLAAGGSLSLLGVAAWIGLWLRWRPRRE